MTRLACWLEPVHRSPDALGPIVQAVLRTGTTASPPFRAIIDTGAAVTLAHEALATRVLGIPKSVLHAGRPLPIAGVGGSTQAYPLVLDLDLLSGKRSVTVPDVVVYFVTTPLPGNYQMLVGQHSALNKVTFVQLGRVTRPYFIVEV